MMPDHDVQTGLRARQVDLAAVVALAVIGGFSIGLFVALKQLPAHGFTRADMKRLLFYRYLRERGELES